MKPFTISCSLVLLVMLACNNSREQPSDSQETNDSVDKTVTTLVDTSVAGCFSQINNRDTAWMQLDAKGITMTGPLSYRIFEKDRNEGTVQAEVTNGVLIGWYLFRSEGLMSVRQVAWKINKDQLWPATGEMKQRNDSMVFANEAALTYDSARPFIRVTCVL